MHYRRYVRHIFLGSLFLLFFLGYIYFFKIGDNLITGHSVQDIEKQISNFTGANQARIKITLIKLGKSYTFLINNNQTVNYILDKLREHGVEFTEQEFINSLYDEEIQIKSLDNNRDQIELISLLVLAILIGVLIEFI